ncbi:MAG TPA: zf-HC2 domain-containing protein [Longimicrobiales bacterium]|nr:zf-HC2 domain-containing protein [Longimicrobiales bacterium]
MSMDRQQHPTDTTIDAYVEELLADAERSLVDAHLRECASCRGEVARQRELLAELRALPRRLEPGIDLRPGVRGELARRAHARRRRAALRALRVPLAAAAVLLIAITAGVTALLLSERRAAEFATTEGAPSPPTDRGAVSLADFRDSRSDYVRTAQELSIALERHRALLSPETVELVEENLRTIDRALREADQALREDSVASPVLRELILATHQKKVEVLRWAISL